MKKLVKVKKVRKIKTKKIPKVVPKYLPLTRSKNEMLVDSLHPAHRYMLASADDKASLKRKKGIKR